MWNNKMNINEIVGETIQIDSACHAISGGMWNVT